MADLKKLDNLLISSNDDNFMKRLRDLHHLLLSQSRFGGFDKGSDANRQKVLDIIRAVSERGDEAVAEFTEKFDGVKLAPEQFNVPVEELKKAHEQIDTDLLKSVGQAIENVRNYQQDIFIGDKVQHPGIKYTPVQRVGVCIPGASAPLPSTVIMTAVPAQTAGVRQIVVVSPPRYNGSIHPVILAVCHELGIDEVYRIGGAQAVAALASDSGTIPKVDKIVGPGNRWVQTAKQMVNGYVGIDSIAGPSEVLILADKEADPAWVAADMLSQAEHGPGSGVVFTDDKTVAHQVLEELKKQLSQLGRAQDTFDCLLKYSMVVVFDNFEDIIEAANDFASEHLQINCGDKSRDVLEQIQNAGAIFVGPYTPVAVGDYWAGPSHTLPTGMTAKFFSPLSSNDFIKSSSIIEYSKEQLLKHSDDIIRLAQTEGLDAHAKSVQIRG